MPLAQPFPPSGVDLSNRVIEVANKLRDKRKFEYDLKVEGDVTVRVAAALDDALDTGRCTFTTVRAGVLLSVFSSLLGLGLCSHLGGCVGGGSQLGDRGMLDSTLALLLVCCCLQVSVNEPHRSHTQGDACALPSTFAGAYDAVLCANLLDRVPDPARVLQQARDALAPGAPLCAVYGLGAVSPA